MSDIHQTEIDLAILRKFAGELVADALGWPGVSYVRVRLSLHETWQSPGGMVVVILTGRPQWPIQFTLDAITHTPNLIAKLRREFDEAQQA